MARFAFIWELGGAYGHLGRMIPVARDLQRRGHEVVFIIRELVEAERLLAPHGFAWYQAPIWVGRVMNLPDPINHAELMMQFGFLDAPALLSMCRAWRNLLALLKPDALLFDYSPTAVLACRGLGLPQVNLANGFQVPPATRPLPPLQWWQKAPPQRLVDSEARVLMTCNQVLYELGAPPVETLLDVLSGCEDFFATLPELDHYPSRSGGHFVGPIFALGRGDDVHWPEAREGRLRVFAYLKPDYRALEPLLAALHALDASVLVHIPGVSKRMVERFSSPHMHVLRQPLDIEQVRTGCDVAVLHSGLSTVAAMLLAGKPLLLLPQQLEQEMLSRMAAALGAAVSIPEAAAGQFPRIIKRALADPSLKAAAERFAAKYASFDQTDAIRTVADRCEALAQPG